MAEYSKARIVAFRIERGHVTRKDEEVGSRGACAGVCHGDCSRNIVKPGLRGRLVLDCRVELARIGRDPALDQAAAADVHRAVEILSVEMVGVDIVKEVGGGDRRMGLVESDDDSPGAGL